MYKIYTYKNPIRCYTRECNSAFYSKIIRAKSIIIFEYCAYIL